VSQNFPAVGAAAAPKADGQLRRNEHGAPPPPAVPTVVGRWQGAAARTNGERPCPVSSGGEPAPRGGLPV
jgi:hypothetical protein